MGKCVIDLGYSNFVLDSDKAMQLMELLADAEVYQQQWRSQEDGGPSKHIFEPDREVCSIGLLTNVKYQMYKLAGKPE